MNEHSQLICESREISFACNILRGFITMHRFSLIKYPSIALSPLISTPPIMYLKHQTNPPNSTTLTQLIQCFRPYPRHRTPQRSSRQTSSRITCHPQKRKVGDSRVNPSSSSFTSSLSKKQGNVHAMHGHECDLNFKIIIFFFSMYHSNIQNPKRNKINKICVLDKKYFQILIRV